MDRREELRLWKVRNLIRAGKADANILGGIATIAREESDTDLALIGSTNAPAENLWCYWYVN